MLEKNNGVNDKKDMKTDEGNLTYPEYGDREHNQQVKYQPKK